MGFVLTTTCRVISAAGGGLTIPGPARCDFRLVSPVLQEVIQAFFKSMPGLPAGFLDELVAIRNLQGDIGRPQEVRIATGRNGFLARAMSRFRKSPTVIVVEPPML